MPLRVVVTEPEFVRPGAVFASRPDIAWHALAARRSVRRSDNRNHRRASRHRWSSSVSRRPLRRARARQCAREIRRRLRRHRSRRARPRPASCARTRPARSINRSRSSRSCSWPPPARHLVTMHSTMARGAWAPQGGMELGGKTLAVIGTGRIGAATARIAKGFSMRVIGCRRSAVDGAALPADSAFDTITPDFRRAVGDADFVVLLIPGSPENRHYLSGERLAMLPARAWLVNVARGWWWTSAPCTTRWPAGESRVRRSTSTSVSPTSRSTTHTTSALSTTSSSCPTSAAIRPSPIDACPSAPSRTSKAAPEAVEAMDLVNPDVLSR